MALSTRLELRTAQTLVMTPQLQQAIKLLQLNNLELAAYVEQELEQNPLLERDDDTREIADGMDAGPEGPAELAPLAEGPTRVDLSDNADSTGTAERALDADFDNVWNNDAVNDGIASETSGPSAFENWGSAGGHSFEDGLSGIEQTASGEISFRDHVVQQLTLDIPDAAERVIGLQLVDLLDDSGYISGDLVAMAELLGCEVARVEAVLVRLQQFDPPGIFARDLKECLTLQLRERNRLDPAMQALLDNLPLLGRHEYGELTRICGVDADDLRDMVGEIRALNPKPALTFDTAVTQPITPDVFVRASVGGGWTVELNNDTLPRVLLNNQHHAQIARSARSRDERTYINTCLQSANWLIKSLHQRATTILKVATEIVRQQEGFFLRGIQDLRPLVLRDIADSIEMHESTVSRVTSNKYMATPRGIYELKYFFTTSLGSSQGGNTHSSESVRHRIKALSDEESAADILSDGKIAEILREEGIDIARRTVTKYRKSLGIPLSMQRRRQKSARL